ncbi:MAG: hypothetical protein IJE68_00725 [Clostridia bacterium]|nr:hypothetical protein [Clostridia bacterium]
MDLDTKFNILLTEVKNICDKIDDKFEKIDERFEQIDKRFEQMDNRINALSAEIGSVHRILFKLDVETQNNLRILSDAVRLHNDKQLLFEKQMYRFNDQLDNTTFRVSILEDNHSY